jgi:hypothetical protein
MREALNQLRDTCQHVEVLEYVRLARPELAVTCPVVGSRYVSMLRNYYDFAVVVRSPYECRTP